MEAENCRKIDDARNLVILLGDLHDLLADHKRLIRPIYGCDRVRSDIECHNYRDSGPIVEIYLEIDISEADTLAYLMDIIPNVNGWEFDCQVSINNDKVVDIVEVKGLPFAEVMNQAPLFLRRLLAFQYNYPYSGVGKGLSTVAEIMKSNNLPFRPKRGELMEIIHDLHNLIEVEADGIVNAWNRNIIPWWLLLPQGVSGAIKKTAGYGVFGELGNKPLPLGEARLTSAGRLSQRYKGIIHVAGINMLWTASEFSVKKSVENALRMAAEQGWSSLAFPIIGAGSGGMRIDRALTHMVEAAKSAEFGVDRMIICLWGRQAEKFGIDKLKTIIEGRAVKD